MFEYIDFQRKIEMKADDTESRSSENSDGSARRRRPAPLPPNQNRSRIGSIPDVAVVSQPDLNLSRMSRVSTGSSGSSQDVRPESSAFTQVSSPSYHMQPNNTSTPAKPMNSYRSKTFEDMNNTSAFSRVSVSEERRNNSGYELVNSPHLQQLKPDFTDSPQYRGGHESTPDRDNRLTPDARIDMLTRGGGGGGGSAFSPASPQASQSPHSNYSSPSDQRSRSHDADMSVRSGQGPSPGWRGQQGQPSGSGQRPVKATHPGYPPPSHSPARVTQYDDRNPTSPSTPQKKGNILVSRQGPRPYGATRNVVRARPASAFGAPVNSSFQGDQSMTSPMNNSRPNQLDLNNSISNQGPTSVRASYDDSYNNGPTSAHSNGPVHNSSVNHRPNQNRMERPKSVPPTMFNQQVSSDSDSSYNNEYHQNHVGNKGTPPVPPPRKTRDILSGGRYSVLREPSSPTKPVQGSASRGQWNNNSPGGTSGPRSQTPSQRIGPPKSYTNNNNKPPAPKPMNSEDGEQKKNSIWYEYGCV